MSEGAYGSDQTGSETARQKEIVRSLVKGLRVIQSFSQERPALTLSEVASIAEVTPPTARRLLITLRELGYARQTGRLFSLTPKVIDLGSAYVSSLGLTGVAQLHMETLVQEVDEPSSLSVLDGHEIVYLIRVPVQRLRSSALGIGLGIGTRLSAYATSMGRVLLAGLPPDELSDHLADAPLTAYTERTIMEPERLADELSRVAEQGWCLVDEEFEHGVRSLAAPIFDNQSRVVAAVNLSVHVNRVPVETLITDMLPVLLETADKVTAAYRFHGA